MAPPSSNASRMALYSASSFNSILPPGTIQRSGCRDEEMSKTYKKGGKIKIVINIVLTIILYIFRQEGNLLFLDNIYYLFLLIESVGLAGHFQCHYIKVRQLKVHNCHYFCKYTCIYYLLLYITMLCKRLDFTTYRYKYTYYLSPNLSFLILYNCTKFQPFQLC